MREYILWINNSHLTTLNDLYYYFLKNFEKRTIYQLCQNLKIAKVKVMTSSRPNVNKSSQSKRSSVTHAHGGKVKPPPTVYR